VKQEGRKQKVSVDQQPNAEKQKQQNNNSSNN